MHASGRWQIIEALDQIGQWGSGRQNERGRLLMRFVMAKGAPNF